MQKSIEENQTEYQAILDKLVVEAQWFRGATDPNPPVGAAILDSENKILSVGAHKRPGTAHAEVLAIKNAQENNSIIKGETLIVTLEPCNHQGRTDPCTDAIIRSGIKRVVIGTTDPNHKVSGGGIEKLKQAGMEVLSVNHKPSKLLIAPFRKKVLSAKPWVTIKRAFDTQGKMIPPAGEKTFTSVASLTLAHQLRRQSGAILTGSGTVLADNPLFTVRHVEDHPKKERLLIVLDRRKRVPDSWIKSAQAIGFRVVMGLTLDNAFAFAGSLGILDLLVEAGPTLSNSIIEKNLWDEKVDIFIASAQGTARGTTGGIDRIVRETNSCFQE